MTDADLLEAAVAATGWPLTRLARLALHLDARHAQRVVAGTRRLSPVARQLCRALAAGDLTAEQLVAVSETG